MEVLSSLPPKPEVDKLVRSFFDRNTFPISVPRKSLSTFRVLKFPCHRQLEGSAHKYRMQLYSMSRPLCMRYVCSKAHKLDVLSLVIPEVVYAVLNDADQGTKPCLLLV
jgi:hypothetical protein